MEDVLYVVCWDLYDGISHIEEIAKTDEWPEYSYMAFSSEEEAEEMLQSLIRDI